MRGRGPLRLADHRAERRLRARRCGHLTREARRRLVEEPHEIYAPRVLAGIAGLKDTLEDRALTVVMLRRRRGEAVARIG